MISVLVHSVFPALVLVWHFKITTGSWLGPVRRLVVKILHSKKKSSFLNLFDEGSNPPEPPVQSSVLGRTGGARAYFYARSVTLLPPLGTRTHTRVTVVTVTLDWVAQWGESEAYLLLAPRLGRRDGSEGDKCRHSVADFLWLSLLICCVLL